MRRSDGVDDALYDVDGRTNAQVLILRQSLLSGERGVDVINSTDESFRVGILICLN